jgi:hypothetical protein
LDAERQSEVDRLIVEIRRNRKALDQPLDRAGRLSGSLLARAEAWNELDRLDKEYEDLREALGKLARVRLVRLD